MIKYYVKYRKRFGKFLIVGTTAACINLLAMHLLVEYLVMGSRLGQNIANFLAMEIGVLSAFFLNRIWTWKDVSKGWIIQLWKFHMVVALGLLLRLVLFPILQFVSVDYLLNTAFGIGAAALLDFVLYNEFVFVNWKQRDPY